MSKVKEPTTLRDWDLQSLARFLRRPSMCRGLAPLRHSASILADMGKPLADSWAKLDWAKKNFDELGREIDAWKKDRGETPPFSTVAKTNPSDYSIAIAIDQVEDMPESWKLRTGNIITDLRSALDFSAWQMVQRGRKPNLTPEHAERVTFPIVFGSKTNWNSLVGDKLPGVDPRQLAVVQRYQPYQPGTTGQDPKTHPLRVLAELSREGKHRHLTYLYTRHSWYKFRVVKLTGFVMSHIVTPPQGMLLLAKSGTELARIHGVPLVGSPTKAEVIVEIQGTSIVGFENGIGLTGGLDTISKTVAAFLSEIEPLMT